MFCPVIPSSNSLSDMQLEGALAQIISQGIPEVSPSCEVFLILVAATNAQYNKPVREGRTGMSEDMHKSGLWALLSSMLIMTLNKQSFYTFRSDSNYTACNIITSEEAEAWIGSQSRVEKVKLWPQAVYESTIRKTFFLHAGMMGCAHALKANLE